MSASPSTAITPPLRAEWRHGEKGLGGFKIVQEIKSLYIRPVSAGAQLNRSQNLRQRLKIRIKIWLVSLVMLKAKLKTT